MTTTTVRARISKITSKMKSTDGCQNVEVQIQDGEAAPNAGAARGRSVRLLDGGFRRSSFGFEYFEICNC